MALKDDWKKAGKDLVRAATSLCRTVARSVSEGAKAAEKWANEESDATTTASDDSSQTQQDKNAE